MPERSAGPELSELDLALINVLQVAPRISWGDAGDILGTHPTTLAARWDRLRESGTVWLTAQPKVSTTPPGLAFVSLVCLPGRQDEAVRALSAVPQVVALDVCSGGPDLSLLVSAESFAALTQLLEARITSAPGVRHATVGLCTRLHTGNRQWMLDVLSPGQLARAAALAAPQPAGPGQGAVLQEEHLQVAEVLLRDGRATAADVARATGLHPATARRYLQKVLASGQFHIRCDLSQPLTGMPVNVQWAARLDAANHDAAAALLAKDQRTQVVASLTGRANFLVIMWMQSPADALDVEQSIQERVPGIEIIESMVTLRPVKRLCRVLDQGGVAVEQHVPRIPVLN